MMDTAIIGGGLSGLALAKSLLASQCDFSVYEARNYFGGRIYSVSSTTLANLAEQKFKFDLGPSWVWPDFQPRVARMLRQENIDVIPQWIKGRSLYQTNKDIPAQAFVGESPYSSARRIDGGSDRLIAVLLQQIPVASLNLNYQLQKLSDCGDHVKLQFDVNGEQLIVRSRRVVVTIPPRLIANSIVFEPVLDTQFWSVMKSTTTWMAGHAKAVICYENAFWREADYSGSAYAAYPGAILGEMFDAGTTDGKIAALAGFFALPAKLREQYRKDLQTFILSQLVSLYGEEAAKAEEVFIKDWAFDQYTATADDKNIPTSHPEYGHQWLQLDHWNEKLFFAGTETAREFGGYLEGALASAERVKDALTYR